MLLRRLDESDLEAVLTWRNHPDVRKNMYTQHVILRAEHEDWYRRVRSDDAKQYFVYERDGVRLGVVGFTQIDRVSRRASWAFYSAPDAPRGTGARMEFLALEHAFGTLELHKLHCEVLAFNSTVIKMHCGFGFQVEGTLRDHYFDGTSFHGIVQLGILSDEWLEMRQALGERLQLRGVR